MNKKEIIEQLNEVSLWITEMLNEEDQQQEHIQDMLKGIENAVDKLSMDVIEVDISFYHPDDNEDEKVYDEEGMREEFENKLKQLI
jgi:myo-inositol catabolism protein IolC